MFATDNSRVGVVRPKGLALRRERPLQDVSHSFFNLVLVIEFGFLEKLVRAENATKKCQKPHLQPLIFFFKMLSTKKKKKENRRRNKR